MQQQHVSKFLLAAALTLGLAGGAYAQSGLPDVKQQGDVSYVSGGVGLDESNAFQRAEHQWPLSIRFTGAGGEYLSGVHVSIMGHDGEVLKADTRGPYMLVRLAPGAYKVSANYNGKTEMRNVTVPAKGDAKLAFSWAAQ
ncbi:carboxypeptidase-like regulatory domain-containing protein [Burkholderia gladioli]|uniref:carboxypeptidase-like regulatory domain-containing protein n=1 Tax=Burkholderia gladioli TaxID=28095 RepID=UPI00163F54C6|nr:carboxypeptidase-like regulatory domain-containing protein [Burkholderia gladioli]